MPEPPRRQHFILPADDTRGEHKPVQPGAQRWHQPSAMERAIGDLTERRLPGPDGTLGKGLTPTEAVQRARAWWNLIGRWGMPDAQLRPSDRVVGSRILNGLHFDDLLREDALQVIRLWYCEVWAEREAPGVRRLKEATA